MKLAGGTWVLLWAVLALGAQGDVPWEELSEIQNKAVQLVMENFHKRDYLKSGFKVASVVAAGQEDYSAGIFVHVEFIAKQTACHKHHWSRPDCTIIKNPNTFNCFGCYKFEYETHSVISEVKECVLPKYVTAERASRRSKSCKEVELKHNGKKIVGSFSFLKSQ